MVVVDSSGWIEHLCQGPEAGFFEEALEAKPIVPSIVLTEVRRFSLLNGLEFGRVWARMREGMQWPLDADLALSAAELGLRHRLHISDSIIYATALAHDATLWTMDEHFEKLPRVKYIKPRKKRTK
ncbi:MAG: type II toxin-antitoxin system VapC family toxin [Bryobacteraceae bacterium]|nr:type II toxin-antitoxin system VapC family toxin [Bryobacteraceae bacterium]